MAEGSVKASLEDRLGAAILTDEGVPGEIQEKPLSADFAPENDEEAVESIIDDEEGVDPSDEEIVAQEASEEVSEGDSEGFVEVEFDGVVYEVPENLKDALLRQSDYTQKTQSLADQRREVALQQKQVETVQAEQQFVSEIQPDLNNMGYLQAQIQQMENELQTNLASMTSEQMFQKKIQVDGLKEQMGALRQALEMKYKDFEEAQKQSYQELLEQGSQVLKQSIPDWNEVKQKQVRDFALAQGFSEQEVSSIIDPRHVKVLYAAAQYNALKDKAAPVVEKAKATVKPKARTPKQSANDKKLALKNQLRSKKMSSKQKADLISQDLGERFG